MLLDVLDVSSGVKEELFGPEGVPCFLSGATGDMKR